MTARLLRATRLHLAITLLLPASVPAQTLVGTVLEEGRNIPIAGATVSLVDQGGEPRAVVTSDSLGRFQLTPPEVGDYVVEAVALGYAATSSPLFAMMLEGSVPFDLMLRPDPIGLEGFEVSVEPVDVVAERLLQGFGLTIAQLGNRWIDRDEIAKRPGSKPSDIIRWQNIPGMQRPGFNPVMEPLCIRFRNRGQCALTILNGVHIQPGKANYVNPGALEAIAILRPMEATMLYGDRGFAGAVLMWTRPGGQ